MAQLVCPTLVGRDAELARLDELLDQVRGGRGRLVVVSGEAGIGKTRLVSAFADRARTAGIRTLMGRAVQTSVPVAYRPVIEAIQDRALDPGLLKDPALGPYRAVLERLFSDGEAEDGIRSGGALAVMEGLRRMLDLLSEKAAVMLMALEDLHWADADTLAFVEYLADHLDSTAVLCICTERTETSATSSELIATLAARRAAERLELAPLADPEVDEMSRLTLGVDEPPAALGSALRHRASGVPFLVEEVLSAYVDAGGPDERSPEWWISRRIADALPRSYHDIVRDRLMQLGDDARRAVEVAAVLGRMFDWRLLATITEASEHDLLERLRAASRVRLIAPASGHLPAFEFRHALAREAVLAELLPPERAALSAHAAQAIEAKHPALPGESCQRVADLWEDAGEPLRAMGALQEAARRAIGRSAFASAEQILGRARALAGDDWMAWMGVDDLLLDALAAAGKPDRVVEIGTSLIDVYSTRYMGGLHGGRLARLHLKVARGLVATGDWDLVAAHLKPARDAARDADDAELIAASDALEASSALAEAEPSRADRLARSAMRAAERAGTPEPLCEALDADGRTAAALGDLPRARDAFMRCAQMAARGGLPLWEARALREQGAIDEITRGDLDNLREALTLARRIGAVSLQAAADLALAWGHLGRAELEAAEDRLAPCLEASRVQRLEILPEALAARCMLHALRDEPDQLAATEDEALQADSSAAVAAVVRGNGEAVLAIVRGDEPAALVHLEALAGVGELPAAWPLLWLHGLRALLATAAGSDEATESVPPVARVDPRVAAYLGYSRAIVDGRAGLFDRAADAFDSAERTMPPGWRREHARLVVARLAFAGDWGEPERWIREALTFLDAVPLARFSAASKSVLRSAGAPVPRRGRGESAVPLRLKQAGVTSREMDVLNLVAERLGNKEIGACLYLSPRTIEGHVASLIRKLDLDDRADLIAAGRRFAGDVPAERS